MGEVRRCHMPAVLEAYEDAGWKQRLAKEAAASVGRLSRTLERHEPGSSTQSLRTVSTATRLSEPFPIRSWKPLERDSPLFASGRSFDPEHGVSGLLGNNVSSSRSLPSLVAPDLSPANAALRSPGRPSSSLRDVFETEGPLGSKEQPMSSDGLPTPLFLPHIFASGAWA